MYCRNCGEPMNDNQEVCLKCGVKTGNGNAYCPNCGQTVDPGAAHCPCCGIKLWNDAKFYGNDLAGQDKVTMAVICFFLGGLGIHNFMMGETKKGIFKIICSLCCGLGYIFALIDFIKILSDSYVADPTSLI